MSSDLVASRKGKSFKQAEGIEPLPAQLRLGEVTPQMRSLLFFVFHEWVAEITNSWGPNYIGAPWAEVLKSNHVMREHRMADEFSKNYDRAMGRIKEIVQNADYAELFDFVQFVLQHNDTPDAFSGDIAAALERSHSAYRVVDKYWIAPLPTKADQKTVEAAFETVAEHGLAGARTHLREAASAASAGDWARCINASVDALEATVRTITGKSTFAESMKELEAKTKLHKALGNSIRRFYDFTSDEKGLRHSNAELAKANVDEVDALYALGLCSASITMLVRKAEGAGLV